MLRRKSRARRTRIVRNGKLFFRTVVYAAAVMTPTLAAQAGAVLYVDNGAAANGDGASWESSYRFLADALVAAQPGSGVNEIRVGQGVYVPDRNEASPGGTGDRASTFAMIDGVAVLGGYAGLEASDPDARDIETYVTILSGDLLGDDDDGGDDRENSHHVVTGSGTNAESRLDGVTVTAGNSAGSTLGGGAGLAIVGADLTVSNCVIAGNSDLTTAGSGAGAIVQFGAPRFEGCLFTGNTASSNTSFTFGGGAVYAFDTDLTLAGCTFSGNQAGSGGALFVAGDVTIEGCVFVANEATFGGAIHRVELSQNSNRLSVVRSEFHGNTASIRGGAIDLLSGDEPPVIESCVFLTNRAVASNGGAVAGGPAGLTIGNCVMAGNTAGGGGAAVVTTGGETFLFNCTITANEAGGRAGGLLVHSGDAATIVNNCIAWNNTSQIGGAGEAGQIDRSSESFPLPVVNHCIVQGLTGSLPGVGNLDADPRFALPAGPDGDPATYGDNDYRPAFGSPAIDAGHVWGVRADSADLDDDGNYDECTPLDLDDAPRFSDDVAARDTGCGPSVVVDIGAYERQGIAADTVTPGDVSGDGIVDFEDLIELLFRWGDGDDCAVGDFDINGVVESADLQLLLFNWS